ncbi:hypothetical protein CU098_003922 [Rhizopus stolonifer]|uniref:Rho GTPase-activating protein 39 n=1 Tax=Rhizopus stolonifer TaxID=4846 RepID=A0A367JPF3_RHIST|nr:hypothetical protein CU098_003922 [Rhizopus stolonifer]
MSTKEEAWVEIPNPISTHCFYANLTTGEGSWTKPANHIIQQSDWWELWDEKNKLPYYYHTRANTSNWIKPTDAHVISLLHIKLPDEFASLMHEPISKRNSKSLDLPHPHDTKRHTRSTSDGGKEDIDRVMIQMPPQNTDTHSLSSALFSRKQSYYSVQKVSCVHNIDVLTLDQETHDSKASRRASHFSAFSSFTKSSNPLKSLVSRSSESRYSLATQPEKPTLPAGLQQEITRFAIDGFAQKYFSTHKQGLFRRRVPMHQMLKWTKDSIKQPLMMLNKDLHKDALKCFKQLQMIMGDRPRSRHSNDIEDIQSILTCGITKGQMRDEIYVQICKQLEDNPHSHSIKKGWEMLCIVTITFPPSKNLESYLTDFVQQHHQVEENKVDIFSQHVSIKLKRICIRGAKGKVLTSAEINRAKEAPFKPSVFGESLDFIMQLQANRYPPLCIPQIVPFLANTVRETHGQMSEGIFRVSGDADAVTDLRVRIENGNYDATGITDPNVPASLLKYWLRDLAEPIVSSEDYEDCIQYAEEPEKAIAIINRLPDTNRRIALFTISFLQEFTDPSVIKHTLMNVNNLAMVFAPNFLRCPSESLTTVFENSKYEQAFLRTLINEMVIDAHACAYDPDTTKAVGHLNSSL